MEDSARAKHYHRTRRILGVAAFILDALTLVLLLHFLYTRSLIGRIGRLVMAMTQARSGAS